MVNEGLQCIGDYPFDRLRALLDPVSPRINHTPISLAVGEPQHAPPELLRRTVDENAHLWGRYPPIWGTPEFRAAAAGWLTRRYGLPATMIDPEGGIIPVSGTREALFMMALTVVPQTVAGLAPVVLMPNPFYQVYLGAAVLAGEEPVFLPATAEGGFLPDFHSIGAEALDRTVLAYYCSPANPQGAVAGLETLKELVRLARKHDFVIAFDECYSEIYDAEPPPGGLEACAALGGALDHVLVFNSLSKRSSAPGLRSGFVAGDRKILHSFKQVRDYGGAPPPMPLLAAATALWGDESHVEANRALYRQKFDLAEELLAGRFGFYRPPGGFCLWLDVGDGEAAALKLWREAALRVIPGIYLGRDDCLGGNPGAGYVRCAIVHDLATTAAALERLSNTL